MPVCKGCGGSYDSAYKFCPNCGRAAPSDPNAFKVDVTVHSAPTRVECPVCHRTDLVRKVTAIHRSELQKIQHVDPKSPDTTPDRLDGDTFSLELSVLGKQLSPPREPQFSQSPGISDFFIGLAVAGMGLFVILSIFFFIDLLGESAGIPLGIILPLGVIGIAWYFWWQDNQKVEQKRRETEQEAIRKWRYAMERWDQLYYCSRDDCVYIPGEHSHVPVDSMKAYLFAGSSQ